MGDPVLTWFQYLTIKVDPPRNPDSRFSFQGFPDPCDGAMTEILKSQDRLAACTVLGRADLGKAAFHSWSFQPKSTSVSLRHWMLQDSEPLQNMISDVI